MRLLFLRSVCAVALALCLAAGTWVGLHHRQRISLQASAQASRQLEAEKLLHREQLEEQQLVLAAQEEQIRHLRELLSFAVNQEVVDDTFATMQVTATAYTAREEECNAQPWVTASGTPSRVGVIAVSRDLEEAGVKLGDFVIIKGMGLFRVEDRMNKRWSKRIDILHASLEAARRFSKRKVEIMWFSGQQMARQADAHADPTG